MASSGDPRSSSVTAVDDSLEAAMVEALLQVRAQQFPTAAAHVSPAEPKPEPEPELEREPEPEPELEREPEPEPELELEPEPEQQREQFAAQELGPAGALQSALKDEVEPAEGFLVPELTCAPEFPFDVTFSEHGQLGLSLVRARTGWTVVSRAIPGTQAAR